MLDSSIQKVEGIVNDTKTKVERLVIESRTKVESGTHVAQRCGQSLDKILSTVLEVDGMIGEISSASQEQAQGVSEINKAMNQLDQVTHQNTAIAQSAASAAEELSAQANQLRQMVQDLFVVINGTSSESDSEYQEKSPYQQPQRRTEQQTNIVQLNSARSNPKQSQNRNSRSLKIASGGAHSNSGGILPSKDDPRFEDV